MSQSKICYLTEQSTKIEFVLHRDCNLCYPLHNHISVYTIGILLSGSLTLSVNHKNCNLHESDCYLLLPYQAHQITTDVTYSVLNLCLPKDLVMNQPWSQLCDFLITQLHITTPLLLTSHELDIIQNCLVQITIPTLSQVQNNQSTFLNQIKNSLEQTPELPFSLTEMSSSASYSKYYFLRCFKQQYGLTPHQFQLQNRIRLSKQMLIQNSSITEVALTMGFHDQSHFIKQFEKQLGIQPSWYRHCYHSFTIEHSLT